jgi:hypothetical protein
MKNIRNILGSALLLSYAANQVLAETVIPAGSSSSANIRAPEPGTNVIRFDPRENEITYIKKEEPMHEITVEFLPGTAFLGRVCDHQGTCGALSGVGYKGTWLVPILKLREALSIRIVGFLAWPIFHCFAFAPGESYLGLKGMANTPYIDKKTTNPKGSLDCTGPYSIKPQERPVLQEN